MQENKLSIIQPKKSRTLATRLEKFYTTATAKDKKKALEDLTPDERKFLLMSHAVGEDRLTNKLITVFVVALLIFSVTSMVPSIVNSTAELLPYPSENIITAVMFLLWIGAALTALVIGAIYLEPILRGQLRNMLNSIGSAKVLETDKVITPKQAETIVQEHAKAGIFAKLAASVTEHLASGLSLKKHQLNVRAPKQREPAA